GRIEKSIRINVVPRPLRKRPFSLHGKTVRAAAFVPAKPGWGVGRVRRRHAASAHAEPLRATTRPLWSPDHIACTGRSFLAAGGRNRKETARYHKHAVR